MTLKHLYTTPSSRLLLGAFIISFSGVWVNLANVSPTSSAFYRVFFGFIFLFLFSLINGEKYSNKPSYYLLAIVCGTLFVLDLLCWHNSIILIGPGLATLLGNFQVFILAGVGIILLKERYSYALLFSIPLAIIGLFLIVGDWSNMSSGHKTGIFLGLATALFYAAYILTLKKLASSSQASFSPMMIVSLVSSIVLAFYMLIEGESFAILDIGSGLSLVSLGFFSQFFGWYLIATSLPQLNTAFTGLILLLQPSLAFIWDVLFFGRPTSLNNWIGVILALIAIYLGITSKRKITPQ